MLASHPEEVRGFFEDTVAPVARYDDQYRAELLPTLEAYLANDCNMNATARAIYAHRHTIAYRLERVKELTGLDPGSSEDRERLGLGLKAQRIVAGTLRPQKAYGRPRTAPMIGAGEGETDSHQFAGRPGDAGNRRTAALGWAGRGPRDRRSAWRRSTTGRSRDDHHRHGGPRPVRDRRAGRPAGDGRASRWSPRRSAS